MNRKFGSIAFLILFCSCEYSPSGLNEIDSKTELPPLDLSVSIPEGVILNNILTVGGLAHINYSFDLKGRSLKEAKMWLGDERPSQVINGINYFRTEESVYFNTYNFLDGEYDLNFRIRVTSGRNNVLDQLGNEFAEFEFSYPIRIDNGPPEAVEITEIENFDGEIRITFEQSNSFHFENYYVLKSGDFTSNRSIGASFSDERGITSVVDTSYVGGRFDYYVLVNNEFGSTKGPTFTYEDEYPHFTNVQIENESVSLTWTKSKYPKNFEFYRIKSNNNVDVIIYDINDTTLTFSYASLPTPTLARLITSGKYNSHTGTGFVHHTINF